MKDDDEWKRQLEVTSVCLGKVCFWISGVAGTTSDAVAGDHGADDVCGKSRGLER
jgi:hypothetical protein